MYSTWRSRYLFRRTGTQPLNITRLFQLPIYVNFKTVVHSIKKLPDCNKFSHLALFEVGMPLHYSQIRFLLFFYRELCLLKRFFTLKCSIVSFFFFLYTFFANWQFDIKDVQRAFIGWKPSKLLIVYWLTVLEGWSL